MFDLSGEKTTHFFFKQLHFLMENQEIHSYFVKILPAALSGVRFIREKDHLFFSLRFHGGSIYPMFDLSGRVLYINGGPHNTVTAHLSGFSLKWVFCSF